MGSSATGLSNPMNLREIVKKYLALAGGFGKPVALDAFGLKPAETERIFSEYDEDYLISRYLHFTLDPALAEIPNRTTKINGFPQSHIAIDAEIQEIL